MTHPYDPREELDDRDLDPPDDEDEEAEPLDFEEIEEAISGIEDPRIEEVIRDTFVAYRQMREELARWKALPVEHRYVVVTDDLPDPEHPLTEEVSEAAALNEARSWKGGRAMSRTVHLGPWEDLTEFATAPPF